MLGPIAGQGSGVKYALELILPYASAVFLVAGFFSGAFIVSEHQASVRLLFVEHDEIVVLPVIAIVIGSFLLGNRLVARLERNFEPGVGVDLGGRFQLVKEFLEITGNPYYRLNYVLLCALLWLFLGPIGLGGEVAFGCSKILFAYELGRILAMYGIYCLYVYHSEKIPDTYSTSEADWVSPQTAYPLHFAEVCAEYRRVGWVVTAGCGGMALLLLGTVKQC